MNIDSPIGNFISVLERMTVSSIQYQSKVKGNEAITRAVLIDPVIRALGWETSNPDMVELERYYKSTKLDYALFDCNEKVRVIIEAKALGANLADDKILTTLLSYSITYKIPSVFLTDGLVWKHFKLSNYRSIEPVVFNLVADPLDSCARYLIENLDATLYWNDAAMAHGKQKPPTKEKLVPAPETEINLPPPEPDPWIGKRFSPLNSLDDLTGRQPPKFFMLPDESVIPLNSWRDILHNSILFLLRKNQHLELPLPDKAGRRCKLVDYERMPQSGAIVKDTYLGKDVYIYLNYDSNHIVLNAVHALNMLPQGEKKVEPGVAF